MFAFCIHFERFPVLCYASPERVSFTRPYAMLCYAMFIGISGGKTLLQDPMLMLCYAMLHQKELFYKTLCLCYAMLCFTRKSFFYKTPCLCYALLARDSILAVEMSIP